jgi:hypothetical protein
MQKFVKRIQSRLSHAGISTNMAECREAYQAVIAEASWESPSETQLCEVVEYVKNRGVNNIHQLTTVETTSLTVSEPEVSGDELEPIPQPETFDIPVKDMPCLQPPEDSTPGAITPDSALTHQSESSAIAPPIPQSEITGIVNQVFAAQPPALKEQLTDYAMQHAFGDVRQVQEFLEQLRSMEFELMVQTLKDHMKRRGSMLTLLDNLITTQKQEDQERKDSFFSKSQSSLEAFRLEMTNRLAKQSL